MKTRDEVVELFRNKYDYLKKVYPSVESFNESAIKQNQDGGWQLSLSPYAAITLRPSDEEPHETHGAICDRWRTEGESAGGMGYPISDEQNQNVTMPNPSHSSSQNGGPSEISVSGAFSEFENGRIDWHAGNAEHGISSGVVVKMNDESTLSFKTKNLLAKIDPKITELKELCGKLKEHCGKDDCVGLQDGVTDIVRRRRAFDSKAFFMVTFGMLKAGKSTLVNTFVGKVVSPVGRAKETTLRSSIIMAKDDDCKEGIYLYSPTKGAQICALPRDSESGSASKTKDEIENEIKEKNRKNIREWEKANGEALMDFLTGLTTKEEFLQSFTEDYLPFSETELEKILTCKKSADYPNILPPVIRVDASGANKEVGAANLLKDGVAILDTPGLDGTKANMTSDPFLTSLMSSGDYFLLVQSSMSAINKDCQELIVHLYKETKNAPLLVVFNEIAANFWLLPEVEKAKLTEDAVTAANELGDQLRMQLGGISPHLISINAGEASDAVFGVEKENCKKRDVMIDESRIRLLRNEIVNTLREKRSAIKEQNATDRMLKALRDTAAKIDSSVKNIVDKEAKQKNCENERWEKQIVASANLLNEFKQTAANIGVGIEIAQCFAKTMKCHMDDEYMKAGFSVDGNPYHEHSGIKANGAKVDNHYRKSAKEALDKQRETIKCVSERFCSRFKDCFFNDELRISSEPWKGECEKYEKEFGEIKRRVSEIIDISAENSDKAKDESDKAGVAFTRKMFQSLCVEDILSDIGVDLQLEPIVPVSMWKLNFSKDVVYECECFRSYERLSENIKKHFPSKAAKVVAERFMNAIIKSGQDCAKSLDKEIQMQIQQEKDKAKSRQHEVETKLEHLRKAKEILEEMKKIMQEA